MPHAIASNARGVSRFARNAGLVLSVAALSLWGTPSTAEEMLPAPQATEIAASGLSLADLEKVFWACDYAATVQGLIDADSAMLCGAATKLLRARRFNGDFFVMLNWWREHKNREHDALDRAYRAGEHR